MKRKIKKARCKEVLAILINKVGVYPLIREEIWPPYGDFADGPSHFAVLKVEGAGSNNEVMVSIDTVMFLKNE